MKNIFYAVVFCGLSGCLCDDAEPITSHRSDPFTINEVFILEEIVHINVSYAGGCKDHDFQLEWPDVITAVYPPDFSVILYHNANFDKCEAYLTEELKFEIPARLGFSSKAIEEMRITVINSSNTNNRVANR